MLKKIIVTGGDSRFGKELRRVKSKYNLIFRNKKQLNILSEKSILKNLKKFKPDAIIHLAGLSRPMSIHEKQLNRSIDLNIIGTANLVKMCNKSKIKIIFFSTSYVYPGTKGDYKEIDPILPWNNYGWSKLGAEAAVQMYKNSLIIRLCMTQEPFVHKKAYANVKSNFIFHKDVASLIIKILNKKGIINVGGSSQTIFKFAKKYNKKIKKIYSKGEFPKRTDMNLNKLKRLI